MKSAVTDSELSIQASEFVWARAGLSAEHAYLLPVIRRWLQAAKPKRILDLGCGNAAVTNELSMLGIEVVGMDSSASGILIARQTYPHLQLVHASLEHSLPEKHWASYDAVLAVEVIEHLLLPRQLFQRAKEALRKDGLLLLTTPYHGFLKNLVLALTNKFDNHWHPLRDYGHVKFFSRSTISRLFVEQGFKVDGFKRVGRWPPLAKSMILRGRLLPN